jgi:hypothetical protein
MPNQSRRKSSTVRVGIADKSPLVRAGLRHLFENDERFVLVTVLSHPARTAPIILLARPSPDRAAGGERSIARAWRNYLLTLLTSMTFGRCKSLEYVRKGYRGKISEFTGVEKRAVA